MQHAIDVVALMTGEAEVTMLEKVLREMASREEREVMLHELYMECGVTRLAHELRALLARDGLVMSVAEYFQQCLLASSDCRERERLEQRARAVATLRQATYYFGDDSSLDINCEGQCEVIMTANGELPTNPPAATSAAA